MLKIRLQKYGRKKKAFYRIIAIEDNVKINGKYLEELGFYNNQTKKIFIKKFRTFFRLKSGAKLTSVVRNLIINYC